MGKNGKRLCLILLLLHCTNFVFATNYSKSVNPKGINVNWNSPFSFLQKNAVPPTFQISPTEITIPACSSQPITFVCKQTNNGFGNWRYYWTVGPGWTLPAGYYPTFTNYITLTPIANTTISSSVSVQVVDQGNVNNSGYGGLSVLYRAPFTSNAVINGSAVSNCSSSQLFSISGINAGESVAWSVSNPSLASIGSVSGNQVSVNFNGTGNLGDLVATITNACNQSVQKKIALFTGVPQFQGFACSSLEGNDFCSGVVSVPYTYLPSLNIGDKITANFIGMTSAEKTTSTNWEWQTFNTNITLSKTLNLARVGMINFGQTGVRIRAKNACGWSDWQELSFEIVEAPAEIFKTTNITHFQVSPNRVKDIFYIKRNSELASKNTKSAKAFVYTMQGEVKTQLDILPTINTIEIPVNWKKGIYIIKIVSVDSTETHRIVVE